MMFILDLREVVTLGILHLPRTSICLAGKEGLGFTARAVGRDEAICLMVMV